MSDKFLPYGHQAIDEEDIRRVVEVLRGDWLTQGPMVEAFEKAVADYLGMAHAVAFCNGTAALHGAMYAAGTGEGDEVITSPMTFAATSNAAVYMGARPVFADISDETLCLDPEEARKKITERTRVIAPVSYAGYPAPVGDFLAMAKDRGICVIEDACHALGGDRGGSKVGTEADMSVFSFHPVKHITTGEGGMVVTDNAQYAERLRLFRSHGITKDPKLMEGSSQGPWYYEMVDLGYNYRITDLQCALGTSQMEKLDGFIARRRELAGLYDERLSPLMGVTPPPSHPGHAYHLYPVQVAPERRKELFERFREKGIGVQVHYVPVHLQPYYRHRFGYGPGDFPRAERFYAGEISLPMFPGMTEGDLERVVDVIVRDRTPEVRY